ncbi:MAG: ATP-dependent DNA helicase RecG [Candidatus Levyibacteriota bacterium]
MDLKTNLKSLGRGYAFQSKKLEKLELKSVQDLLYHIPSRYEDLRIISRIQGLRLGETVTVKGEVLEIKNEYRTRFMSIQKAIISDGTGEIECRWFNQTYLPKSLPPQTFISLSGSVEMFGKTKCLTVKEFEVIEGPFSETVHTGRLVPVYPLTRGMTSKWLRSKIHEILAQRIEINEFLPETLLLSNHLPDLLSSIREIHFPKDFQEIEASHKRLSYEELFVIQLAAMVRRLLWEKKRTAPEFHVLKHKPDIEKFFETLPFTLTHAQIKALDEIYADLASTTPMNRLLEGDVGSGKTVVAAIALYLTYLNGFQGIFMAPTEILANQHYETITKLLEPFGLKIGLVTGSKKSQIQDTTFDIIVGTHALLNAKKGFEKVGLVVIDEQQRFGVEQRSILREKGGTPHFLTMTATPIPRTVFLTLYGDLSLSVLDEMPKGRMKVKTWLVPNEKRDAGYEWIKKKIRETDGQGNKNQVFIICPFIEESESATTVKAATKEYEELSKKVFKGFKVGLLHGRMKAKEKNEVLEQFAKGTFDVLVATPVVEVGIDIPHATIMVIEAAERFGLASLHQLRGRVGRRTRESFCLLYTESAQEKTRERLRSLETIYVGAELAELDLKLRGPGEIYGTEQHGSHKLKIASFSDFELILKTKHDAQKLFPNLSQYPLLKEKIDAQIEKIVLPD